MPRHWWVAVVSGVLLVVVAGGLVWWRHDAHRTALAWAVDHSPAGAQRLSWTDWAAVRSREEVHLSSSSPVTELRRFLDRAYDDDLSSASGLVTSAPVLQQRFGLSPATVDWELLSQSTQGTVEMLHLPSSGDLDRVATHLRELGYREPAAGDGVWQGGADLLARISPALSPELQYVALDTHDSLVLTSDSAAFLEVAVAAAVGHGPTVSGLDSVVDDAGEPLAAEIYSGEYACRALAMAHAGASDQEQARQLLAAAGEVDPYTAFAMSDQPDGRVRVAFEFDGADAQATARANADARAALARGPAPGQGGSFADRFRVASVTARSALVVLLLDPRPDASVLSDLSSGPVLFATC